MAIVAQNDARAATRSGPIGGHGVDLATITTSDWRTS
jgi:hypothetical protein